MSMHCGAVPWRVIKPSTSANCQSRGDLQIGFNHVHVPKCQNSTKGCVYSPRWDPYFNPLSWTNCSYIISCSYPSNLLNPGAAADVRNLRFSGIRKRIAIQVQPVIMSLNERFHFMHVHFLRKYRIPSILRQSSATIFHIEIHSPI